MENFTYYTPTKVVFGRGTEAKVGRLVAQCGCRRVLVHYGGASAVQSGLVERLCATLAAEGLEVVQLGGVQPNPVLSLVNQGIALARAQKVDFVLAVGGGSVIDSAKAICYGLANDGDVWDFFEGSRAPSAFARLGCVVTIAAAGSEMSSSCVLLNEATGMKMGYGNDLSRPLFAVMDPALTLTVPFYHTMAGCADIMMHTLERYLTPVPGMQITDEIAEGLMRTVLDNTAILSREPQNYDARAEVMWAGALSHNGLTECGSGHGDWAVHQIGHELSARYGLSHGASLTAVWGSWARFVYTRLPGRFARLATRVLGLPALPAPQDTALAGIKELESIFWGIELPTNLPEAELAPTEAEIEDMAEKCTRHGKRTVGTVMALGRDEIAQIYRMALRDGEED